MLLHRSTGSRQRRLFRRPSNACNRKAIHTRMRAHSLSIGLQNKVNAFAFLSCPTNPAGRVCVGVCGCSLAPHSCALCIPFLRRKYLCTRAAEPSQYSRCGSHAEFVAISIILRRTRCACRRKSLHRPQPAELPCSLYMVFPFAFTANIYSW